jgi:hypothetical protein
LQSVGAGVWIAGGTALAGGVQPKVTVIDGELLA